MDSLEDSLADDCDCSEPWLSDEPDFVDRAIVRARAEPVSPVGGLVALFGSLAPAGAILKRSAATPAVDSVKPVATPTPRRRPVRAARETTVTDTARRDTATVVVPPPPDTVIPPT